MSEPSAAQIAAAALAEDLGSGDLTSMAVIDTASTCTGLIVLKSPGVLCGINAAAAVFAATSAGLRFDAHFTDGDAIGSSPTVVAEVTGDARAILGAERAALNLLGHLSGIATLTRQYIERIASTKAVLLDTRKTTPGLRTLEKYAVSCGGGTNHRTGLHDGILIKDNHIRLAGGVDRAIELARARTRSELPIQIEAETIDDVVDAVTAGADTILLDNMRIETIAYCVAIVDGQARLEASGGITLENVAAVASTGVDAISIGALTHSAPALDFSLDVR